jgi:dihydrofolate synthase/folylpolyglutamate synthase
MLASYIETLDYLCHLQYGIVPGLERITRLLSHLSNPHLKFPSVHIGGTNGKGSTAAMTASILKQAGYRVGLYTSPHLIDFSERITINGTCISQEEIIRLTEILKREVNGHAMDITFFEFTTAMAFCYFAESAIDIAVVEVGLGGRFDATNVLTPMVTAITSIDMDHEQYLGHTLLDIAYEKAGIIKEGIPVVTGATQPEVLSYFEEVARSKSAPLIRLGHEIIVSGESHQKRMRHCHLLGDHQISNAAIAIGIIENLRLFPVSEDTILEGMRLVEWPGRLQIIQNDPMILLDGAHNPSGAKALASFLQKNTSGKHWLIVGIMRDKNIKDILAPLAEWADEIVLTRPEIERAATGIDISAALDPSLPQTIIEKVPEAIQFVLSRIAPTDTLVITGSLFTVAEALAHFKGIPLSRIRG